MSYFDSIAAAKWTSRDASAVARDFALMEDGAIAEFPGCERVWTATRQFKNARYFGIEKRYGVALNTSSGSSPKSFIVKIGKSGLF